MSKCDLRIVLDRGDRRFRPGETIAGAVEVTVNDSCRCDALTITRQWRTHGRGNVAGGPEQKVVLFQGEWLPGKTHRYEFSLGVPARPVTYHGTILNVDWYLSARADVPWAIDPKAEEEFLLLPGPTSGHGEPLESPVAEMVAKVSALATGCVIVFLAPFFLAGLGITGFSVLHLLGVLKVEGSFDPGAAWAGIPFGIVFMAFPGFVAFFLLRGRIARRRLGRVTTSVLPQRARPGDPLACRMDLEPRSLVEVQGITATLVGLERVVCGSGTNRSTHTHEIYREVLPLAKARTLYPGKRLALEGSIRVPADAAPSFTAPDNALAWSVRFEVNIPRWPDWSGHVPVTVLPDPGTPG